mmetsp:Transcript_20752/g.59164  ORF Transcript_20752/g.59164 Transcript_20752/m.59164 type:complete len:278 (+) Transcript_20752:152-985(+)
MNLLRKRLWKSFRTVSLMNLFWTSGSLLAWFRKTTSSFHFRFMRPVAAAPPSWSEASSGFPRMAASSNFAFSSSAFLASSCAFFAARSARILANSACSAASSSSSSLSESSESSSLSLASRSSLSLLSSSFHPPPPPPLPSSSSSLASSSLYFDFMAFSSMSAVCFSSLMSPSFSSSGSTARCLCLDHADLDSACCNFFKDSRRAFLRSTTCDPLRNFSLVWEGKFKVAMAPELAPPADHPPSLALPTAAFHVGLCAVVILGCRFYSCCCCCCCYCY